MTGSVWSALDVLFFFVFLVVLCFAFLRFALLGFVLRYFCFAWLCVFGSALSFLRPSVES